MSEKRRRDAMVSVRVSAEELDALGLLAKAAGLSVSAFLRSRALDGLLFCATCGAPGERYFYTAGCVSNGPMNSSTCGPQPQSSVLCHTHALKDFGVSFGRAA